MSAGIHAWAMHVMQGASQTGRFGLRLSLALAAVLIAYAIYGGYSVGRLNFVAVPPLSMLAKHPELSEIPDLHSISFITKDGMRLDGWSAPSRNRAAIILVHGTNGDKASLIATARVLAGRGFGVLLYDGPGYGASEGSIRWGQGEVTAFEAATNWLAAQPDVDSRRIGGYGFSMGGLVVAQGAAQDSRVAAVVLASTPDSLFKQQAREGSRWGFLSRMGARLALAWRRGAESDLSAAAAVARIAPRPLMLIAGSEDRTVPGQVTRMLFDEAAEPKELWVIPAAAHGDFDQVAPSRYRAHLTEFFERALLQPDSSAEVIPAPVQPRH